MALLKNSLKSLTRDVTMFSLLKNIWVWDREVFL